MTNLEKNTGWCSNGEISMCREGRAHFRSQSDANAVLYHSFSASAMTLLGFPPQARETLSGTSAFVRTLSNIFSHPSDTKITFTATRQIYAEATYIRFALLRGFLASCPTFTFTETGLKHVNHKIKDGRNGEIIKR